MLTLNKYEIILYWSDEDNTFVAEVRELAGCFTHGPTQVEAIEHANEAISLWIDAAVELGRSVPAPKRRKLAYA